jgi:osmoprotectant transport system substrate-binding protein
LVLAALALSIAACGDDDGDAGSTTSNGAGAITRNPDNAGVKLTIGSKTFTEQKILGEIYAQALAAAGYDVTTKLNLEDENAALQALKDGQISAYPEYTGTALLSFFDVPADELTPDPNEAFEQANAEFAQDGITALPPTPFTSSNEVAVTRQTAEKLQLETISDLRGKEGDLTLYGSPECRERRDCLLGLQEVYGLAFGSFVPVDVQERHEVLKNGDADVSIVFTTDPQNKRDGFVLLRDDRGMFPPYNSTFLVKDSTAARSGPDLAGTVEKVNADLTDEVMQELNARVDLDRETPKQAAAGYLQQYGFVAAR